ncbi:hypothetical protein NEUTE1DRAFT_109743 [Neurospora tetrasperma FGSC 2508]|uniref:Uncharacterized protein n=1 Tax=Neurospora tetrasperma (strain FGSC 2508 / ATCC MYA-4615 / P0657) TaxID=510951 RepID=F8MKX9_NEUT8|nr:uncharacterized protein NEUTE1DRAFT_109743 [Neurospora tetrasperma FGSC 2508]EGO57507.1 hypothetical protein NEUTE1DRAFT_109743 [Neurospora tetrasperma FGSC 2508]
MHFAAMQDLPRSAPSRGSMSTYLDNDVVVLYCVITQVSKTPARTESLRALPPSYQLSTVTPTAVVAPRFAPMDDYMPVKHEAERFQGEKQAPRYLYLSRYLNLEGSKQASKQAVIDRFSVKIIWGRGLVFSVFALFH